MEEARRLRASAFWTLASAIRLARTWAYSDCGDLLAFLSFDCSWFPGNTYSSLLDLLGLAALESETVSLVLEALGSDKTLDLGGLGVGLLALTLGLDLAANDVLADLFVVEKIG